MEKRVLRQWSRRYLGLGLLVYSADEWVTARGMGESRADLTTRHHAGFTRVILKLKSSK